MNTKKAFTLTELLIVVGIISFLGVMAISFLRPQIYKGNDAKRKGELRRIATAVEEYEKDNDCFPATALLSCTPGDGLIPYLEKIPCDPVFDTSYAYENDGTACSKWWRLFSRLENTKDKDYKVGIGPGLQYNFSITSPNAP